MGGDVKGLGQFRQQIGWRMLGLTFVARVGCGELANRINRVIPRGSVIDCVMRSRSEREV